MRVLWVFLASIVGVGAGVGVFLLLAPRGVVPAASVVEAPGLGSSVPGAMASTAAADATAVAAPSPGAEAPELAPAGAAAASASTSPEPKAASAASAAASADAVSAPEDVSACLRSLFSKDAFVAKSPSLRFVCEEPKPKDIASRLRVAIVDSAGGHVSDSMKEWSQLGFYELAVVAMLRGQCCEAVKPLELLAALEGCGDLGEALEALVVASRPRADEAALDRAVERFDGDIRCAVKLGRGPTYGYASVLPGEASVFGKIRSRMKR
jgi:hypothetical protein